MEGNSSNTAVATQPKKTIANFLHAPSTTKFLSDTLSDRKGEFVSNLIALCDADKNLAECDPAALMKCALNATALNLPLNKNLGYAYVIPYKGVPSFQIGYKGLIQLAIRTGQYKYLNATAVREGEIKRNKITGHLEFLGENPAGKVSGYIAYLEMMNGFSASLYMSEGEIEKHAERFSQMYKSDKKYGKMSSKWSDPDARPKMALKTVLKGLLGTYGLMTTEFAKALETDNDETETDNDETEADKGNRYQEAEIIQQEDPTAEADKESQESNPKLFKV
ncbi:MAG: recombinase RecT [Prevotellaceae bacterium]|jgi:recombination protein RecT|nr:recombinase RecT [Prevotellaceae bacterium]